MTHALLTFDLEDWFQLTGRRFGLSAGRVTRGRLKSQVSTILDLLSRHNARATFFVLGMTAESCPEVVTEVLANGHEIASHGFGHELVSTLDPERFRVDLQRSIETLEAIGGSRPTGYRAPEFSIDQASLWAFDVLLDCGIAYDSSVFPFKGPRYGFPDAPLDPYLIRAPSGRELIEVPLAVVKLFRQRVPVAGGGYWRLLPAPVLEWALQRISAQRTPMLYFHPAEFDARMLNLAFDSLDILRFTLKQNVGRSSIPNKLLRLLNGYSCIGVREFLSLSQKPLKRVA